MSAPTPMRASAADATVPLDSPTQQRAARATDLAALHELALRSKAYWGYDAAFMASCRDELRLSPEELGTSHVALITGAGGAPIAMAQVVLNGALAELHKLFIDPDHMGHGLGRQMMHWAVNTARAAGATALEIEADPGAAPFYERMGAQRAGSAPSGSIPGRLLPRFLLAL